MATSRTILNFPSKTDPVSLITGRFSIREAGYEAGYIETYYADGTWCSRRYDSDIPFAAGDEELEQIALGSQVARWNRLPHIIRAADGSITETIPAP